MSISSAPGPVSQASGIGPRIVLASNNRGKLAELQAMFAPLGYQLVCQADLGVPEAPEPFRTFV